MLERENTDTIKLNVNGKIIETSRKLLIAKSKYFETLLNCDDMKDTDLLDIKIDADPRILGMILNFANNRTHESSNILRSMNDVKHLIQLAHKFNVNDETMFYIHQHCLGYIKILGTDATRIEAKNIIDIYNDFDDTPQNGIFELIKVHCISELLYQVNSPMYRVSNDKVLSRISLEVMTDIFDKFKKLIKINSKAPDEIENPRDLTAQVYVINCENFRNLFGTVLNWRSIKEESKDDQIEKINDFCDKFVDYAIDIDFFHGIFDKIILNGTDYLSKTTLAKLLNYTAKRLEQYGFTNEL